MTPTIGLHGMHKALQVLLLLVHASHVVAQ
jgi:hypothetical protein